MVNRFIAHPLDVVQLNQSIKVRVLDIDLEKEKISLSMKTGATPSSVAKSMPTKPPVAPKKETPESPGISATIKFI